MILKALEKAYQLDPELPLPYESYEEACRLHGRKPVIPQSAARLSYEFPIGYRRRLVIEAIGPLRLTLPGAYQYEWEENGEGGGTNLWSDDSVDSPVWRVSAYQTKRGAAGFSGHLEKQVNDLVEREIPNGRMRYGWWRCVEEKNEFLIVEAEVITEAWFYLITVACNKPEERAGIEELLCRITVVAKNRA